MNRSKCIATAAIFILVMTAVLLNQRAIASPAAPSSGMNEITVSLGQEFTLKKGEIVRVKGLNVFLKVKDFIYSPCPAGSYCIWSGVAVVYELTVGNKVYSSVYDNSPPDAPYHVQVKESDYKTYATFIISELKSPST